MAFSIVTHGAFQNPGTSNGFTSSALNTTGADTLVVALSETSGATGAITDSNGNTWVQRTKYGPGINTQVSIWYAKNATVGAGHTFTVSGTGNFPGFCVLAVSGGDLVTPFDVENGGGSAFASSLATGSITPTNANALVLTAYAYNNADTVAAPTGFTLSDDAPQAGFGGTGIALAYLIETSIAAQNPTWSQTNAASIAATIASFNAAGAATAPFVPTDTAGRSTIAVNPQLRTHLDPLKVPLLNQDKQFAGPGQWKSYDWTNPRLRVPDVGLRTHLSPLRLPLRSQDKQFGAAGQWKAYDWPNPTLRPATPNNRTHLSPLALNLRGQDVQFGGPGDWQSYDWPNPQRPRPLPCLYTQTNQDTLVTVLAAPTATPFVQVYDWPNPQPPRRAIALLTETEFYVIDDSVPFAGTDWPNPPLPRRAVDLLTWTVSTTVLGTTPTPSPFAQTDFPNPVSTRGVVDNRTWLQALTTTTLAPVVAAPFTPVDAPNPVLPRRAVDLLTWTALLPPQGTPVGSVDWPNPIARTWSPANRTWTAGLPPTTPATPVGSLDWPNPAPKPWSPVNRTWTQGTLPTLVGQDAVFGAPGQTVTYDWPNPRGPRRAVDLLTWTATAPPAGTPVASIDWPNPLLRRSVANLTATASLVTTTLAQPVWGITPPNPWGATIPLALRTHLQSLTTTTLAPAGPKPFLLTDWPVPAGPRPASTNRTHVWAAQTQLFGLDAFYGLPGQPPPNYDWPVPKGPRAVVTLRTLAHGLLEGTFIPAPASPALGHRSGADFGSTAGFRSGPIDQGTGHGRSGPVSPASGKRSF